MIQYKIGNNCLLEAMGWTEYKGLTKNMLKPMNNHILKDKKNLNILLRKYNRKKFKNKQKN